MHGASHPSIIKDDATFIIMAVVWAYAMYKTRIYNMVVDAPMQALTRALDGLHNRADRRHQFFLGAVGTPVTWWAECQGATAVQGPAQSGLWYQARQPCPALPGTVRMARHCVAAVPLRHAPAGRLQSKSNGLAAVCTCSVSLQQRANGQVATGVSRFNVGLQEA